MKGLAKPIKNVTTTWNAIIMYRTSQQIMQLKWPIT